MVCAEPLLASLQHAAARLLHALVKHSDLSAAELAQADGLKPQAVSNQLQWLVNKGIPRARASTTALSIPIISLLDRALAAA
jgi:predicted ArsR family transcriptional regulator